MTESLFNMLQITLHHSNSASVVLIRCITVRHTFPDIALVQELWLDRNRIGGVKHWREDYLRQINQK